MNAAGAPFELTALRDAGRDDAPARSTGVVELDRVLGAGLVDGSTTLLFGEPGVGKSTLALMALHSRASLGDAVVLVAAEESATQVGRRAQRLGEVPASLGVVAATDVASIERVLLECRPGLMVVDSISAVSDPSITAGAGSVPQVRHAAERLCRAARSVGTALVLVGHVTKDGDLAGPRTLEHLVDTVIRIDGDRHGTLRTLRCVKHRFGPTDEVGLMEMGPTGLRDLVDPAAQFAGSGLGVPGVVVGVALDGSRATRVEFQALVTACAGPPRRVAHQVSSQRLSLMLAVLDARCAVATSTLDVFAATAGGLAANEPGVDAALALAVASAVQGFAVDRDLAVVGEVGLAGELRAVAGASRRVREAQRLGATRVMVPVAGAPEDAPGVQLVTCATLADVLGRARNSTK
ncbi:MAG TPA: ATPase domain-containing protein [Acidimicrobiales bacterium]|nr:ATPase domain-containing protein [Acidimicrobiales bacterium]